MDLEARESIGPQAADLIAEGFTKTLEVGLIALTAPTLTLAAAEVGLDLFAEFIDHEKPDWSQGTSAVILAFNVFVELRAGKGKGLKPETTHALAKALDESIYFASLRKNTQKFLDSWKTAYQNAKSKLGAGGRGVNGAAGNWQKILTKLDNLELPNLKAKLNTFDEVAKNKFADDIANLSDDALKQLEDNFGLLDEWKQIDALSASAQASRKPAWLQKILDGNEFNRIRSSSYPNNEIYLVNPNDPSKYVRLDSYKPGQEIVSRKYTQFSEIQESTGIKYIQELKDKYPSGIVKIADVPSNKVGGANSVLQGGINQPVTGQMFLEIPVQTNAIPQSVINEANKWGIKIRDVQGKIN